MSVSGRKLAKRACDGCKIRKIKCTEVAPCDGCVAAGIACTFVKQPLTRGPRRLRKSTLREITQSQQQWEDLGFGSAVPDEPVVHTRLDAESVFAPNKVAALVLQLCVYRLRMYPVWPIIKVERLVASLQRPEPDIEVFGLAYAVAAATIAQIRTKPSTQPGAVTAEMMEAQCQYAKVRRNKDQPPDLTTVRIPFFLHMYYENLEPGGLQSITYLREAIAIAHMIGLHRETYYSDVQPEEREIRRRTLWLLFVAERNISICHKLPVTIRTKIAFPGTIDSDSEHVLAAYQRLVTIFWDFDRSGVFELLDRYDFDFSAAISQTPPPSLLAALIHMRKMLDENSINIENMEDTQALDLLITRQWMRVILWRLTRISEGSDPTNNPLRNSARELWMIVKELLVEIAHTPENAIEAHSSVFEIKIFEITASLMSTIEELSSTLDTDNSFAEVVKEVLTGLGSFLARNDNLKQKAQSLVNDWRQEGYMHPSISLALSTAIQSQSQTMDVLHIDPFASLGTSESSPSSTGVVSSSQASVSPRPHWSTIREFRGTSANLSHVLTSNPQYVPIEGILDRSHLDMDWSQWEQTTESGVTVSSAETWQDIDFGFNET